ncbi:MAG: cryptochrome/photolyase family protein [Saprospiraceae bacterium]
MKKLRLILGDQLNAAHSWFRETDPDGTAFVLMEVLPETRYVRHHVQKVVGFFLAMRAFAAELRAAGHRVFYLTLDDPANAQSFEANCRRLLAEHGFQKFEYQLPDEWRVDVLLRDFAASLDVPTEAFDTEHFLTRRDDLKKMFAGKKTYLMESFYRKMREKHGILMEPDGKAPLTGRWNYDAENRKKLPRNVPIPPASAYHREVGALVAMLEKMGVETIGTLDATAFDWPVTRRESLELLRDFVRFRLAQFGDYQDALSPRHWLLFHSRLSFALNIKLLHPREVVEACIGHWRANPDSVGFSALEGFVRQIVGWREYVRGIYWAEMPGFRERNFFGHSAPLPVWFWTGRTRMACLAHAVGQSLERAYAHHIQRLMVTGNFALLLGCDPDEVDAWYLGIYMDALEWVEITNTRGMSQFADGGLVGTKPYVSSANYLHKMGNYCATCHYDRNLRHGPRACPFNSLYWDFYDRHAALLRGNPRIGMAYQVWDKMPADERARILEQAEQYKQAADAL